MDKIISIVGLTSSGKSDLAISLAKRFDGEIVSADSRQVYKGLDYCSGKVSDAERREVPHHLLDVAELGEQFTLYQYQKLAYKAIDDIVSRGKLPFLVGGTGLYSRSVVDGYVLEEGSPNLKVREKLNEFELETLKSLCEKFHIETDGEITKRRLVRALEKAGITLQDIENFSNDNGFEVKPREDAIGIKKNPKYKVLQIGIRWDREKIYQRIQTRLELRMPNMIKEIKTLMDKGTSTEFLKQLGLESKCVTAYLLGEYSSYEEFFEDLFKQERHFAKRQQTWYNKESNMVWLDAEDDLFGHASALIEEFLKA